jgi:hypothetical protein
VPYSPASEACTELIRSGNAATGRGLLLTNAAITFAVSSISSGPLLSCWAYNPQ